MGTLVWRYTILRHVVYMRNWVTIRAVFLYVSMFINVHIYNIQVKYYSNIYIVNVYDQVYPCIYRTELNTHYHHTHTHSIIMHVHISRIISPCHIAVSLLYCLAMHSYGYSVLYNYSLCIVHFCLSVIFVNIRTQEALRSFEYVALADCGEGARESHPCRLQCIYIVKVLLHAL